MIEISDLTWLRKMIDDMERMRCGECRRANARKDGKLFCPQLEDVVPPDFGCIQFEETGGDK